MRRHFGQAETSDLVWRLSPIGHAISGGAHDLPSIANLGFGDCPVCRDRIIGLRSIRRGIREFWKRCRWCGGFWHERWRGNRRDNEPWDGWIIRRGSTARRWQSQQCGGTIIDAADRCSGHDWDRRRSRHDQFRRSSPGSWSEWFSRRPDRPWQYRPGNREGAARPGRKRPGNQANMRDLLISAPSSDAIRIRVLTR
jgi:hypothetical protein